MELKISPKNLFKKILEPQDFPNKGPRAENSQKKFLGQKILANKILDAENFYKIISGAENSYKKNFWSQNFSWENSSNQKLLELKILAKKFLNPNMFKKKFQESKISSTNSLKKISGAKNSPKKFLEPIILKSTSKKILKPKFPQNVLKKMLVFEREKIDEKFPSPPPKIFLDLPLRRGIKEGRRGRRGW